jgi:predicted nuclease of predicted toxin-antitoxin system
VRLLLDAHVSARRVGRPLARKGHDVLALSEHAAHEGLDDEDVLMLAAQKRRILITHDIEDFPPILREWATEGRSHAGVILVYGIRQHEFRTVIDGVSLLLAARPDQREWIDLCEALSRHRFES